MSEPNVEARARALGWVPKEEFPGDKERWKDADEFVTMGETMLPIVKSQKKALEEKVHQLEGKLSKMSQTIQAGQEALEEYKKYHEEDAKRRVKVAIKKLKADIVTARRDGDIDAEVEASAAITQLTAAPAKTAASAPAKGNGEAPQDYTKEEWFQSWMKDNDWYGPDPERTMYAEGAALHLNRTRPDLKQRAYLDEIARMVKDKFPDANPRRGADSKVDAGRPGSQQSSGRSYSDLPADAKTACDRYGGKVVGQGRAYKTLSEWRKKYAEDFFAE